MLRKMWGPGWHPIDRLGVSLKKKKVKLKNLTSKIHFFFRHVLKSKIKFRKVLIQKLLPVSTPNLEKGEKILCKCKNVYVCLYRYMVTDEDKFYLYEKKRQTPKSFSLHIPQKSLWSYRIKHDVLGILWIPMTNYYHCVKDIFIQIYLGERKNFELPFLFIGKMNRFHSELKKMVAPKTEFIKVPDGLSPYFCPSYYTLKRASWDIYHKNADDSTQALWDSYINKMITEASQNAEMPNSGWPEKVYFSRQNSSRRFQNGAEVEELLAKEGFRTVYLETLNVATQIKFAANAKIVVGSHGANLTNLFFCKPATRVLEISSAEFKETDCYKKIGDRNNLKFTKIVGSFCVNDQFFVNPKDIKACLKLWKN